MSDNYTINYSADALGDLKQIYAYIANELLAPENASNQLARIRKAIRSLNVMPSRHALVDWDPWHSMNMHQLPVDNYIVYYVIDDVELDVTVVRIFYGARDIEGIIALNEKE